MIQVRDWIEFAAHGLEIMAVAILISFILTGVVRWIIRLVRKGERNYERFRVLLGRTLLIALEFLVAADIIRTVALDVTAKNLALLGGVVLVRTFLSWTLTVEIEGRWPWQARTPGAGETM